MPAMALGTTTIENIVAHDAAALEKQGMVERAPEPGPRRERAALLTSRAQTSLAQAETAVADVLARMLTGLDPTERDALRAGLTACRDALLDV